MHGTWKCIFVDKKNKIKLKCLERNLEKTWVFLVLEKDHEQIGVLSLLILSEGIQTPKI